MGLIGGIELVCTTSLLIKNELFAASAITDDGLVQIELAE